MTLLDALTPRWAEISALLDEALALPADEREAWLESLIGARAELKDSLRRLLDAQASVETGSFLNTLPKLDVDASGPVFTEAAAGTLVGPYRLVSELGRGGMGAVWLAERADGQLKRRVALKLPHMTWSQALGERLARERDMLASLEHVHIARLYDAGIDHHGRPYLAMEYVEGEPIDVYCSGHALPLRARLSLLLQVCDAVAHAHSRLVVHRDLKPGNILVTPDGQVRLLDFGIAKLMEGDRTQETALTQLSGRALTPDYASPEQIRGEPLGTASDVYSLAVVAFELLTGARPYRLKRGSAAELEEAIASIDAPLASHVAADAAAKKQLRGDLDAILNRALKKTSSERYASVDAFAQDLRRFLDDEPVVAQPDRLGYRLRKFMQRHRLQVVAAGLVGVAVVGGAGVSLWQAQQARAQAARAEEVKRFVLSIFRDADSDAGGNRRTTAIDLLKQARARLAAARIDDAATRVEVLAAVGHSLIGQGDHAAAREVLEDAAAQADSAGLAPDHPARLTAQLRLGEALSGSDGLRAMRLLGAAEHGLRRIGDHAGVVDALRLKAARFSAAGEFEQAIASAREAVELAEAHLTQSDRITLLNAYSALTSTMSVMRRPRTLAVARKAYELAREIEGGRVNNAVLTARAFYAYALVIEGMVSEGLTELKALLAQQIELYGPDHTQVGHSLQRIGLASLSLGDPLTAADSFREALRIQRKNFGEGPSSDAALQQLNLGGALLTARRFEAAEAELRRAVATFAAAPDTNPAYARLAQAELAVVLTRRGRLDEADAIFARLLAQPITPPIAEMSTKARLVPLRSRQGRHAEAIALAEACAAFGRSQSQPSLRAILFSVLGHAHLEAGDAAAALTPFRDADAIFAAQHIRGSPARAVLQTSLARTYLALGRPPDALAAADAALQFWRGFEPRGRDAGVTGLWQARAFAAAGEPAKAREALRDAATILATAARPPDHVLLAQVQRELQAAR